jgi:protein O-GlcNAc transferase
MEGVDPAIVAAVEQARRKVVQSPRSANAWGLLGTVLVVHEFRPEGNFCLARAERLAPGELRWPYFQALSALRATDVETALPKLERTVALGGDRFDSPRVRLAELLLSLNRLDEAEAHFQHLVEKDPRHAQAHLGLARLCSQRGKLQESLRHLDVARNHPHTRKAAHLLLAEVQHRLGNAAAAEQARQRAAGLSDDPYLPDPLNDEATNLRTGKVAALDRARSRTIEGNVTAALALLTQTVRDYPEADDAWLQLGQAFLQREDPEAAEKALRRAIELAPLSHLNHYYLGAALIVRGDDKAATRCFRKAIALKPDYAPAHHNLGNCLVAAGDTSGALDAYRTAVRCEPNLFETHVALATLLAQTGQLAEALVHARHALRLKPADPNARQLEERVKRAVAEKS